MAGFYTLWQLRQKEQSIDKKDGEGVVESKKLIRFVSLILPNELVRMLMIHFQRTQRHKSTIDL